MKLTWLTGKQIRFDFDTTKADDLNNIPISIDPNTTYGTAKTKDGKDSVGIIIRWRIYSVNSKNDEVLGYLREAESTIIEFGTKETDLPVLTKFCSDSFINVEIDFQEKIRLPYNIFGHTRPSFDKLGQFLLQQLVDAGYYS